MNSRYKDKLVGVYAPGNYGHTSVLEHVEFFRLWFYTTHQKKGAVATKLGIDIKKLNRILTLEQLPDEELLKGMMELCEQRNMRSTRAKSC